MHIGPEGAVAQHQLAIIDAQAGVGDGIIAIFWPDGQPSDASCAEGGISPKVILNISSAPSVC
jgi:hypothetical protein